MRERETNEIGDAFERAKHGMINARYNNHYRMHNAAKEPPMTWEQAFEVIISSDQLSSLTSAEVFDIKLGARECDALELRNRFLAKFLQWQATQWLRFRDDAVLQASGSVGRVDDVINLPNWIFVWPQLRYESQLRHTAIEHAMTADYRIENAVSDLAFLNGTIEELRSIVDHFVYLGKSKVREAVVRVIESWTGATPWGEVFGSLLSGEGPTTARQDVAEAVKLLRQLTMDHVPRSTRYGLFGMSGATRTAWRGALRDSVNNNPELRDAVTEAVLWLSSDDEDRFAQLTALHINIDDPEAAIGKLMGHPSLRLQLRARSAVELAAGKRDPVEAFLLSPKDIDVPPTSRRLSKTWLNDPTLEQLLVNGFSNAAESLADEVRATASAGEETLVAKLFERLKNGVSEIGRITKSYARETDKREYLHFALDHRFVGKSEEGAEGLGGVASFSSDVTLIMKGCRPDGKAFAERAVFLQAKRMYRGKAEGQGEYYEYDVPQVRDLAEQSTSSFLLSVGPRAGGVTIPVMPARLFLERFDNDVKTKRLDITTVAGNSRNLAEWLVDDVIGLWTGDSRGEAIERARYGRGDTATLVVELDVRFVPLNPDDLS